MSKPLIQLRNARVCKSPRMSMLRTAQSSVISVRRVRPSARVWFLNGDASVLNWGHWVLSCVRPVSADLIKNLCLNFGTWRYNAHVMCAALNHHNATTLTFKRGGCSRTRLVLCRFKCAKRVQHNQVVFCQRLAHHGDGTSSCHTCRPPGAPSAVAASLHWPKTCPEQPRPLLRPSLVHCCADI